MPIYTDQIGNTIEIKHPPQRIISLVPSQTELLYSLGLEKEVIGITKFCVHPESWFRSKTRIGGTKNVHLETIDQLQPHLVIANKEENVQEQVKAISAKYPVWVSDVNTLQDAYEMMQTIGNITNTETKAAKLIQQIQAGFNTVTPSRPIKTAYLIWREPYMTIGHDTFIHHLLQTCGFANAFAHTTRYPAITIHDLQTSSCEVLLLSSEPYPFQQKHIDELQAYLPQTRIILTDGELFSWYGSRLLHAPAYFAQLIAAFA